MDLTLGAALLAGLISFLSPCVLPVVPAYLGQLGIITASAPVITDSPALATAGATALAGSGPGMGSGQAGRISSRTLGPERRSGWRAMPNAIAFVLGFGLVFTVLGVAASWQVETTL